MLTRLALFVSVLTALLSSAFAQPSTINGTTTQYINNGGFESGSLYPGWTSQSDAGVNVQVIGTSAQMPSHSGAYVLSFGLHNGAGGANAITGSVTQSVVTPGQGKSFLLSFYLQAPSIANSFSTFNAYFNNVLVPLANVSQSAAQGATYVNFQGTVVTPSASAVTGTITIAINATSTAGNYLLDDVTLTGPSIVTSSRIVGDPQFVGLRGQSYQVHGMDGEVYNIVTDKSLQVNSRFVFLSAGECPIIDGKAAKNCWSHPGSYLGAIGVQQVVDGKVEQLALTAGDAKTGFASIMLNGDAMKVGESYTNGVFSVSYKSKYVVSVNTELFSFEFDNSDMFINQQVKANVPLSTLTSHGLFGQTHQRKLYSSALRYIEGEVDDYVVASQDLFGADCMYNKFSL